MFDVIGLRRGDGVVERTFGDTEESFLARQREQQKQIEKANRENALSDRTGHLTTAQIGKRAERQFAKVEAQDVLDEHTRDVAKLLRTTPGYVDSQNNLNQIVAGLRQYVEDSGREWRNERLSKAAGREVLNWTSDDLYRVLDCLAEQGFLELSAPLPRRSLTEAELRSMPREGNDSLRTLAEVALRRR